ncbi:thioredoxin family protein [Mesomycoplasma molare]|uniref:Thioredoxin n=1 Tax=Mesomycoplasma molare TaxID=171288 RepID=A0ABY5TTL0_9BACT|nr:thioredoxin family protein [Mesomycoplasma molare]UWD34003.1 thioredoxin family protein [Mesomycoplasma molare]
MLVKDVTKSTLGTSISNGKGVQLLNFHATWCGPCKMLAPVLKQVAEELKIEVYKVDVDQDREFAREMGVSGTPTTFIYKDGKLVSHIVGYGAFEQFAEPLKKLM